MVQINKEQYLEKMAANLPTLRTKLNYTQAELGDLLDVSRHTILSIENRKRQMTWSTFLALVLLFSVNEDTMELLKVMKIYTPELEEYIKRS